MLRHPPGLRSAASSLAVSTAAFCEQPAAPPIFRKHQAQASRAHASQSLTCSAQRRPLLCFVCCCLLLGSQPLPQPPLHCLLFYAHGRQVRLQLLHTASGALALLLKAHPVLQQWVKYIQQGRVLSAWDNKTCQLALPLKVQPSCRIQSSAYFCSGRQRVCGLLLNTHGCQVCLQLLHTARGALALPLKAQAILCRTA